MVKRIYSMLLLACFVVAAFSQATNGSATSALSAKWARSLPWRISWPESAAMAADTSGSIYLAGVLNEDKKLDFGDGVIVGPRKSYGPLLVKFSASGRVLWASSATLASARCKFSRVAVDDLGNALALGTADPGRVDFGGSTALDLKVASSIIVKFDGSSGKGLWARALTMDMGSATPIDCAVANQDAIYVVVSGSLIHLDSAGTITWRAPRDPESSYYSQVQVDRSGGVIAVAREPAGRTISFGGGLKVGFLGFHDGDAAMVKFTPSGEALWAKRVASLDLLGCDKDDAIYMAGFLPYIPYDFGDGVSVEGRDSDGRSVLAVVKYDSSGIVQWKRIQEVPYRAVRFKDAVLSGGHVVILGTAALDGRRGLSVPTIDFAAAYDLAGRYEWSEQPFWESSGIAVAFLAAVPGGGILAIANSDSAGWLDRIGAMKRGAQGGSGLLWLEPVAVTGRLSDASPGEGKLFVEGSIPYLDDPWGSLPTPSQLLPQLLAAIERDDLPEATQLANLFYGVDPNRDFGDPGPVSATAARGNLPMLRMLLGQGASVDETFGEKGPRPAIYLALEQGKIDAAKLLIENGAAVAEPLGYAIDHGMDDFFYFTLGKVGRAAGSDLVGRTPLMRAAGAGRLDYVQALVKKGVDINALSSEPYIYEWEDSEESFNYWVESQRRDALATAIDGNHFDVAKLLLQKGARASVYALEAALRTGNEALAKDLLKRGSKPRAESLVEAVRGNLLGLVERFLKEGIDPDARGFNGESAVGVATDQGKAAIAQLLRAKGAIDSYRRAGNFVLDDDRVNVRDYPDTGAGKVIGRLDRGQVVRVLAVTRHEQTIGGLTAPWYKIEEPSGWVFGAFLSPVGK